MAPQQRCLKPSNNVKIMGNSNNTGTKAVNKTGNTLKYRE